MFSVAEEIENYSHDSLDTLLMENNPEEVLLEIEKLSQYFAEVKNPAYGDIKNSVFIKSCEFTEEESRVLNELPLPHDNMLHIRRDLINYRGKIERLLGEEPESNSWTRYSFSRNEDVKAYRNTVNQILITEISSE